MMRMNRNLPAVIGFAALLLVSTTAFAQVSLGTSGNFGALGGSAVTNTGASVVTGDVGVSPGSSVTGFPPGVIVAGVSHSNDAVAMQAQSDLTLAYNAAAGLPCNVDLTGQDLGGLTLTPGVYCFTSTAQLTGTLTLDFQGNSNALFVFKTGSTLTTASASSVVVINGGATCQPNLFWQIGSSATLGTGSSFVGNILAQASITLTTGSTLTGRALARTGAVTLDTNNVTPCTQAGQCPTITVNPATLPGGSVALTYGQTVTGSGGTMPYTFAVTVGALPNGLALNPNTGSIAGIPTAQGTFNFTVQATDATQCSGTQAYSIAIGVGGPITTSEIPTVGFGAMAILALLLAIAAVVTRRRSA